MQADERREVKARIAAICALALGNSPLHVKGSVKVRWTEGVTQVTVIVKEDDTGGPTAFAVRVSETF